VGPTKFQKVRACITKLRVRVAMVGANKSPGRRSKEDNLDKEDNTTLREFMFKPDGGGMLCHMQGQPEIKKSKKVAEKNSEKEIFKYKER
jgi:hypothetical protein